MNLGLEKNIDSTLDVVYRKSRAVEVSVFTALESWKVIFLHPTFQILELDFKFWFLSINIKTFFTPYDFIIWNHFLWPVFVAVINRWLDFFKKDLIYKSTVKNSKWRFHHKEVLNKRFFYDFKIFHFNWINKYGQIHLAPPKLFRKSWHENFKNLYLFAFY
jgi:hypothetical protein